MPSLSGPHTPVRCAPVTGDPLGPLWDFADLDASEQRFRGALEEAPSAEARAAILTQLARLEGLRGRFEEGDRLLEQAEALAGTSVRVLLERGRLRRSSGNPEAALPLFASAYEEAVAAGEEFLAADAAAMAALAAADGAAMLTWTQRGLDLARPSGDPQVAHWEGALLNNLGWADYEAGRYEQALDAFAEALRVRERRPGQRAEIEIARYALGKTLRALGRPAEAATLLEQAVAWTVEAVVPDGWFHEELAEDYAALGRDDESREQAQLALPLLEAADPSFADDAERAARLRELATEP
jgi:tetratricopeptide (TPR) repeat protein